MKDVADRAGVSRSTASFVINDRQEMRISGETQERVRRAARELDYRPNFAARALATRMTRTIAFLSNEVATDGYAGELITGALLQAIEAEHLLFVGEFVGDPSLRTQLISDLLDRQVDGFVYASTFTRTIDVPDALLQRRAVLVNCVDDRMRTACVIPDDRTAGVTAATHLLDLGHRRDVHLVGETPTHLLAATERLAAVVGTLEDAGVALAGQIDTKWWPESAYEGVATAMASNHPPRALICMNDRVALGAYQAIKEAGADIPGDVSVIGFDDSHIASWLRPQLTSIAIPHRALGRRAVELLVSGNVELETHRLPMRLRPRASTAPPRSP